MNDFESNSSFDPRSTDAVPASLTSSDDSGEFEGIQVDADLQFISRMLMEEDVEDKIYMFQGDPALVAAAEKPFYDILNGNDFPISPDGPPLYADSFGSDLQSGVDDNYASADGGIEQIYPQNGALASNDPQIHELLFSNAIRAAAPSSFAEIQSVWQFNRGMEEASKFLPDSSKLIIDITSNGRSKELIADAESRGVKNQHDADSDPEEGRRRKQSATSFEDSVPKELYDEVLLCVSRMKCGGTDSAAEKPVRDEGGDDTKGGKSKGRKQRRREVIDLRSLLILCAQSVSADDRLSANQQLKQIRQHSSITGDGSQRLAHYFADGLEARLSGIGSEIYRSHMVIKRRTSAADILKAYRVYMTACPFKKISYAFSNQTILRVTRSAPRIHMIDLGIGFGFHVPCLIGALASRPSGPPKLRITAIDFPQPGFRPCERLEETGRRLAEYAQEFGVPFEYHAIAAKWETVKIEDLDLRDDELLVVTCVHMLENLADETVHVDCPRDVVLNNIRKMNPAVFIHGVVNGAYSSPFFVTRFREALFHFSAIFDAFDCIVDSEDQHRLLLERELFGQEILNVIACEGAERVQRPETYKQWQVRNRRCGFTQLPLDPEILKICKEKIKSHYNKDFLIDTDGKWMVQGWKGRVQYAVSAWKPASSRV